MDRISRSEGGLLVSAGDRRIRARNVVVAMADFQRPRVPDFAPELDRGIAQMHSSAYCGPAQLRPGGVLLVGLGNSGAEIAREVVRAGHETYVSGKEAGELPFRIDGLAARLFLAKLLFRVVFFRVLRRDTRLGRLALKRMSGGHATPLIRVKTRDLAADGVVRVPRTTGVREGKPLLEDGRTLGVTNVIWCTGFEPGFSWIDVPVFDERGMPVQTRGITPRRAGPQLRGAALPLRDVVVDDPRGGAGRGVRGAADRGAGPREGGAGEGTGGGGGGVVRGGAPPRPVNHRARTEDSTANCPLCALWLVGSLLASIFFAAAPASRSDPHNGQHGSDAAIRQVPL